MPYAPGPPWVATNANRRLRKGGTVLSFLRREEGQGLAEYALILALIAVLVVAVLIFLGGNLRTILSVVGSKV